MIHRTKKLLFPAVLLAALPGFSLVSPTGSPLLPLIPAGAESVAGVEDPHNPEGHLLLISGFNRIDLNDWLSLAGVDDHRAVDELIWVIASSSRGELREHLLLIAGRFDRERIYAAAQSNGAAALDYHGFPVLIVAPFARERGRMPDVRWVAILDHRVAIFGTPDLVQKGLDRRAAGESADPALLARLSRLGPGVNSWNTMAMPSSAFARHLVSGAQACSGLIAGADELTVGVHYGSTARIEFSIGFTERDVAVRAAGLLSQPDALRLSAKIGWQARLKSLSIDGNLIAGSISMPERQFDAYLQAQRENHWPSSPSQNATVAPTSRSSAGSPVNSLR